MHRVCTLLMVIVALLTSTVASAAVVDRVVVVVEDEIILASDVRVEGMLTGLDASPLPFYRLDHATSEERLIMAALVRALAGQVALYDPAPEAVRARVEALRRRLGPSWKDWLSLTGLDDEHVERLIRRRMRVESYLTRNLPLDPSDTEAWLAACHELLDGVRGRFLVRRVPRRER